MNKTIKILKDKSKFESASIVTIVYAILALACIVFGLIIGSESNPKNQITTQGIVESFSFDDKSERYVVILQNNDNKYVIGNSFYEKRNKDIEISSGDNVSLIYPKLRQNNIYIVLNEMYRGNQLFFSGTKSMTDTSTILLIGGSIAFVIFSGLTAIFILKVRKKEEIEVNRHEYITGNVSGLLFLRIKGSNTRKEVFGFIYKCILWCITIILSIVLLALADEFGKNNFKMIAYIIGIIGLVFSIFMYVICLPYFNKKKRISGYVEDYKNYLSNEEVPYADTFSSNGFVYTDYYDEDFLNGEKTEPIIIPYEQLHLYVSVTYSNTFQMATIFLCSDIDEKCALENDIYGPLDPMLMKSIKDNNIKVEGLDYLLEHFEEELNKHNSKKINKNKVVIYKDSNID